MVSGKVEAENSKVDKLEITCLPTSEYKYLATENVRVESGEAFIRDLFLCFLMMSHFMCEKSLTLALSEVFLELVDVCLFGANRVL